MNRLQKKCIIATAGFHLLLLLILFVGPAFFWEREKEDDTQVLEMIPANVVDSATTGIQGAQPPPPAPAIVTPPQPAPTPTPVKPEVTPPVPVPTPTPKPEKVEPVKPVKEPTKPGVKPDLTTVDRTPVEKSSVTKPPSPKVNLTPITRPAHKNTPTTARPTPAPDNSKAVSSALRALRNNLSSPTEIAPVGNSSVAAANYGQIVKSVYEQAWILPDEMASDQGNTKVRVTIASDGTVISARIVTSSGDAKLDESVRRTLDRVKFIERFPAGSTDKERSYIINFNPQIKRMNG